MMKSMLFVKAILFALLSVMLVSCGGTATVTEQPRTQPTTGQNSAVFTQPTPPTTSGQAATSGQTGGAQPLLVGGKVVDVVDIVERTRPAVVSIVNQQSGQTGRQLQDVGSGSGVIISPDGVIVTNNHVIENAQRLIVTLPDGRTFEGRLVGRDPRTDLAVVKVNGQGLPTIPLGTASDLKIGQTVIAIGNALALPGGPTVTTGVVSALGRSIQEENGARLIDLVQTDAAINPGNSGGALIDLNGRLIGINTAIANAPGGGIGFAVSVDTVRPIGEELYAKGSVTYTCLGISDYVSLTPTIAASYKLPSDLKGVAIVPVANGPAARAGLQQLDVIVAINGQPITDEAGLLRETRRNRPGETITISYVRGGTQRGETRVTLVECGQLR